MSILEVDEEQKYVNWCKKEKIICEKVKFMSAGYPDRLSVLPSGLHVWIEFKRAGEKPKPIQCYRISMLRNSGAYAGWTNDSTIAIAATQALLDATRLPEKSDSAIAFAVCRGTFFGSWIRENFDLSSSDKDIEVERLRIKSPNCRPAAADVQSLARRDKQVGGF